jgi:hypothetical protein
MPHLSFGPLANGPDPVEYTKDDRAREIFQKDVIPAIAEVANSLMRGELTAEKAQARDDLEITAKMFEIWQEVFDLLHKRVREEFPDIGETDRRVRDAWRW